MPTIKPDWYCIVNPHAGCGKTLPEWSVAEKHLTRLKVPFKATLTNYKFHASKLAYEACLHGYRKLLAVGGDGSVHEVLCGIMQYCDETLVPPEEFTLAVVPIGSGNDWIKTTKVPHDTKKVVELIASESFDAMDIVRVETADGVSYMANVGGTGFDAHVCKRANALKDQGRRSSRIYVGALLHTVFTTRKFDAVISSDGNVVFDGPALSVALGNGPYSGGGMLQVPLAVNNDGWLDFMIVPKISLLRILREIPNLFKGSIHQSSCLYTGRCKELLIAGSNIVEVDGEIKGNLPLKVSVTGSQIKVLVGKSGCGIRP